MTNRTTILYLFSLPKCSLYRRAKLFVLRQEVSASILCAFVFWVILGMTAGSMLFLVGNVILKAIFG